MVTSVEDAFNVLLERQELTPDQSDVASKRIPAIADFLASNLAMAERAFPMGSYARGTLCRSERDLDILAPLAPYSPDGYWERYKYDSRAFLYWIRKLLNDRYYATNVSSKQVAVKLDFSTIVVEVVPCFPRKGGGYLMPNGSGGWMNTNPPYHTTYITDADRAHGNRLKPLIKLIKFWNIANGHHLRSFHVEMMVTKMWKGYTIGEWPAAVAATLKVMGAWVKANMDDPWPAGSKLNAYLTADTRDQVVRMLADDAKAADQAEKYRAEGKVQAALECWNVVYRHLFPAYG